MRIVAQTKMDIMDDIPAFKKYREVFIATYPIRIKAMYSYSDYQMEVSGIPVLDSGQWDIEMANQTNIMQTTIAQMAELNHQQIPFTFQVIEHIPLIYEHIDNYLRMIGDGMAMNHVSEKRFRRNTDYQEVIVDMQKFVDFANRIYNDARWVNGNPIIDTFKGTLLDKARTISFARPGSEERYADKDSLSNKDTTMKVEQYMHPETAKRTRTWRIGG